MVNERILSYSRLDPNIVVERFRLYRKIIHACDGRWADLDAFVQSAAFKTLMDRRWIIRHDLDNPSVENDGTYYEIDYIPHFNHPEWWTNAQFAAALSRVAEINAFLSKEAPGWLASDCHAGNVTFVHADPIYTDTGSFSKNTPDMAKEHFAAGLAHLGLPYADWEESIPLLASYHPAYSPTEWDSYDKTPLPTRLEEITPANTEQSLLLEWTTGLGTDLLDLGSNHGKLSRLFATHGYQVVALDISSTCVDACWKTAKALQLPITSLCLNVSNPLRSLDSLSCDVVVASSITHHLFRQGMDWPAQERLFRCFARRWLLIEQIEPSDPHIQSWGLPASYSTDAFTSAFRNWQAVAQARPELPSRRWLKLRAF